MEFAISQIYCHFRVSGSNAKCIRANELDVLIENDKKDSIIGFIGGPPCPDFSTAGKNKGINGDNGKLSKTYFELICKEKPDFFIFENVKGLWRTKKT
ncbi:MAG: DNA cytosine methyltransferase [Blautia hansenii]